MIQEYYYSSTIGIPNVKSVTSRSLAIRSMHHMFICFSLCYTLYASRLNLIC
jgi:hypothetical protein